MKYNLANIVQNKDRIQIGQKSVSTILQALTKLEHDLTQTIRKDNDDLCLFEDEKCKK